MLVKLEYNDSFFIIVIWTNLVKISGICKQKNKKPNKKMRGKWCVMM